MLYFISQQKIDGISNKFNPNELGENSFYVDIADLLSDCHGFNNGQDYEQINDLHYKNSEGDEILIGMVADDFIPEYAQ